MRLILPALLSLLSPLAAFANSSITIAGSDLLRPIIEAPLTKAAEEAGITLNLNLSGSVQGRKLLEEGSAALGILAIPQGQTAPEGFLQFSYASQVATVVVHNSNPLAELSLAQLASIFGQSGQRNIRQWGEMDLGGAWSTRSINLNAVRGDSLLTMEIFTSMVMQGVNYKPQIRFFPSADALIQATAEDVTSISIIPYRPRLDSRLKIVALKESPTDFSYRPTPEAVQFGDYPLTLSFVLYYSEANRDSIKPLLRTLLSDELANALNAAGFVPMTAMDRREELMSLDMK